MWVESGGSQVESGRVWLQASDITGLIWATVAMGVAQKTAPNKPLVRHWWHCRTREEQRLLLCLFLLAHTFVSLGWSKIRVRFCMKATERRKSTKESRKCQLEHQPGIIRKTSLLSIQKSFHASPVCESQFLHWNPCSGPALCGTLNDAVPVPRKYAPNNPRDWTIYMKTVTALITQSGSVYISLNYFLTGGIENMNI